MIKMIVILGYQSFAVFGKQYFVLSLGKLEVGSLPHSITPTGWNVYGPRAMGEKTTPAGWPGYGQGNQPRYCQTPFPYWLTSQNKVF
jgi:hypothetical protein